MAWSNLSEAFLSSHVTGFSPAHPSGIIVSVAVYFIYNMTTHVTANETLDALRDTVGKSVLSFGTLSVHKTAEFKDCTVGVEC